MGELALLSSTSCKNYFFPSGYHPIDPTKRERCNDKENDRMAYDSILSERALREIYLMPFMLAQKYAKPWAVMTASAK